MTGIMHFAPDDCKRLLHYSSRYALCVETPNERLRHAREQAGFESAVAAAESLGVPVSTYIGHENGHRGFPAKRAPAYARKFRVSEEWLLYGKGPGPDPIPEPTEEELKAMLAIALAEVPANATIGDWPRIVAPILRDLLGRFRAGELRRDSEAGATVPGKDVPPLTPTRPDAQA